MMIMWSYDKKLEYPIKIKRADPKMAKVIITQYGGPDGEIGAALRYLSQRFSMITPQAKATLNDIGTEELAHLEMVGAMVRQLTENATTQEIEKAGYTPYFVDHDRGVYPQTAGGVPFSAATLQVTGDPRTDLYEDLAAEQKARSTYEYLISLASDPDVIEPLKFLREREVVHFQRFGESLRYVQEYLENKKRFSMPKTFGSRSMAEINESKPGARTGDMPGRRIGYIRMGDTDSVPAMQMIRNVPYNESRNTPGTPTEPRLPGQPPAAMPGTPPPGMMMPGKATAPYMRDIQNVPGTPAMPEPRRVQMPHDMRTKSRR
jgi:spore coat protein JC